MLPDTGSWLPVACGFCSAGPTAYLMPFLLVWAAVFLLWCGFRLKYDVGTRAESLKWILWAVFILLIGPVVSIALWSFFLFVWTYSLIKRLISLLRIKRKLSALADRASTDIASALESASLNKHNVSRAAWFHGQMLALLVIGIGARAIHYFGVFGNI